MFLLTASPASACERPWPSGSMRVLVVAALAWAIWEVGFDWWQLGPRGGLIILLGALAADALDPHGRSAFAARPAPPTAQPVAARHPGLIAAIVVAAYSMTTRSARPSTGDLPNRPSPARPAFGGNVPDGEWHQYGRTPYGQRYSPLDQINVQNVAHLKEAWRYQTGDVKRPDDVGETTYQVTPLKVGNTLYLCTPHNLGDRARCHDRQGEMEIRRRIPA